MNREQQEQAAFHRAMRENPFDGHIRLVYADWLEEHGQPEAARRARWYGGLVTHMEHHGWALHPTPSHTGANLSGLDPWQARLVTTLYAHHAFRDNPLDPANDDIFSRRLAVAERYALGLADDNERRENRGPNTAVRGMFWRDRATDHALDDDSVQRSPHGVFSGEFVQDAGNRTHGRQTRDMPSMHFTSHAADYAKQAEGPVKLAAIAPPGDAGSTLVRVPTPTLVEPKRPTPPPAPKNAPAGPAFILPQ